MNHEQQMLELKEEYMRVQNDLEKVESTGQASPKLLERLAEIEQEIQELRKEM